MTKDLGSYFERIGFGDAPAVDLDTLSRLMTSHLHAIPFENLDVQLGRIPGMSADDVFEKIVRGGRGGWCYEMNGLFGWVLSEIGFDVTRIAAGVMREQWGDVHLGNHLALLVKLERAYLVDVGFGSVLTRPIPLAVEAHACVPYKVSLAEVGDGYWRYSEQAFGDPFSFDFRAAPADETLLAEKCRWQATDPGSNFVLNLVAQRRSGDRHLALRGKVLTETGPSGVSRSVVSSQQDWLEILHSDFGLDVPDAETLWPRVDARHMELFGGAE